MFALIYNIGVQILFFFAKIAGFFNSKLQKNIKGQNETKNKLIVINNSAKKNIWIHCASLGEYEMALPLLDILQNKNPDAKIHITFFSASGYEKCLLSLNTEKYYLLADTKKNVQMWYEKIKPDYVFFVKYELWYNYLNYAIANKIPFYLINFRVTENHFIFKFYGTHWLKLVGGINRVFTMDVVSLKLLQEKGLTNVSFCGDTRFDRVKSICDALQQLPEIAHFKANKKIIILGSSWPTEEKLFSDFLETQSDFFSHFKVIIAPHDISHKHINEIYTNYQNWNIKKYSEQQFTDSNILLIDNIGMLSKMYRYGDMAFIGGAFGKGLHNILEAAVYGMPILFGPHIQKFPEAHLAIAKGVGRIVQDGVTLTQEINLLQNDIFLELSKQKSIEMVEDNLGASARIADEVDRTI